MPLLQNQLIINIFEKNTPLHDGAVIIKKTTVLCGGNLFPSSYRQAMKISMELGTRHRAAIAQVEVSDASVCYSFRKKQAQFSLARGGVLYRNHFSRIIEKYAYTGNYAEKTPWHKKI